MSPHRILAAPPALKPFAVLLADPVSTACATVAACVAWLLEPISSATVTLLVFAIALDIVTGVARAVVVPTETATPRTLRRMTARKFAEVCLVPLGLMMDGVFRSQGADPVVSFTTLAVMAFLGTEGWSIARNIQGASGRSIPPAMERALAGLAEGRGAGTPPATDTQPLAPPEAP